MISNLHWLAWGNAAPKPSKDKQSGIEPEIGDLCLFHFPECPSEPYGIGKLLEYKITEKWGRYGIYHWCGQHPNVWQRQQLNWSTLPWYPQ